MFCQIDPPFKRAFDVDDETKIIYDENVKLYELLDSAQNLIHKKLLVINEFWIEIKFQGIFGQFLPRGLRDLKAKKLCQLWKLNKIRTIYDNEDY